MSNHLVNVDTKAGLIANLSLPRMIPARTSENCSFSVLSSLEAVGDTRAYRPGIEGRLPVSWPPATVTSKSGFSNSFFTSVDASVMAHHVVEPDLQRSAERVLDLEIIGAAGLPKITPAPT